MLMSGYTFAQTTEDAPSDIYQFSVEQDILTLDFEGDATVYLSSASGRKEDVNKTPYQAYVVTKEEIEKSGAITIAEALRLAPGVLVKQKTNGLYEVYINGTDNIPSQQNLYAHRGRLALVMVDNMPVNDQFRGGVLWETLPISLSDVEKIEVVASPSSVLQGRDAATGFINIITKTPEANSLNITSDIQGGTSNTLFSNAAISFGVSDKVYVRLSGKYNSTRRFQDEFYVASEDRYIQADSLLFYQSNAQLTNLHGSLSREDMGLNAFVKYQPNDDMGLDIALSTQDSEAQDVYERFEQLTFIRRNSTSSAINLNAHLKMLQLQASYTIAEQNLTVGYPGYRFDGNRLNTKLSYQYDYKNLSITPGLRYQSAEFDDSKYIAENNNTANIINGNKTLMSYGGFLSLHAGFMEDKLVLDGGVSYDQYDNDNALLNYQFAAAYAPIKKLLVRASYSTGNQGMYALETFDQSQRIQDNVLITNIINEDLGLMQTTAYGAGARVSATDKIMVGLDYFHSTTSNLYTSATQVVATDTLQLQWVNANTDMTRSGFTANVTAKLSGKFKFHAFATMQSTDYAGDAIATDAQLSPKYFGGMTAHFTALLDKLNVSASAYAFGEHEMMSDLGSRTISSKIIPALKVSYKVWQENKVFINVRNPFGSDSKEYLFADNIPGMYLLGASIKF